jgi:DNA-binding LacI/PurR family transcriptional regulator
MSIPLYKQIQKDIFQMIASGQLREGDRIASESEIMKQYYVSSITARNALNSLVDQGLARRVKGKGTFVSSSAFSVSPGRCYMGISIGAVFPWTVPYIQYMDEYCQQRGFGLYIRYTRDSPDTETILLQRLANEGITGILLFPAVSEESSPAAEQLARNKMPFVFLDRYLPGMNRSLVVADNRQGARLASEYLLNTVGANIAALHFPLCNNAVIDRLAGFREGFEQACEPFNPFNTCVIDDLLLLDQDSQFRIERILSVISAYLRANSGIRGFFAVNAEIAQVAYYAVRQLGFIPGSDFHIVSFDNPYLPGVHFIQQDYRYMVKSAIDLLCRQFNGDFTVVRDLVKTRFTYVDTQPSGPNSLQYLVKSPNHNLW